MKRDDIPTWTGQCSQCGATVRAAGKHLDVPNKNERVLCLVCACGLSKKKEAE